MLCGLLQSFVRDPRVREVLVASLKSGRGLIPLEWKSAMASGNWDKCSGHPHHARRRLKRTFPGSSQRRTRPVQSFVANPESQPLFPILFLERPIEPEHKTLFRAHSRAGFHWAHLLNLSEPPENPQRAAGRESTSHNRDREHFRRRGWAHTGYVVRTTGR